ncbi:MAG: MarR family winged helix-turn-helix transcriptional regulator [Anaerolineae bacterium]
MTTQTSGESLDHVFVQVAKLHFVRAHDLFQTLGLYRGQPPLLCFLADHDSLPQSRLAEHLGVTAATVSRMLERMEKAGFVNRTSDPADQRVTRVHLTDRGRAVQGDMRHLIERIEQETFAGFSPEERVAVRGFLMRMRDNLDAVNDRPDPSGPLR